MVLFTGEMQQRNQRTQTARVPEEQPLQDEQRGPQTGPVHHRQSGTSPAKVRRHSTSSDLHNILEFSGSNPTVFQAPVERRGADPVRIGRDQRV